MQRVIILLICIVTPIYSFSIDNDFEYITAKEGLSQSSIECIFQDSKGFLWIGTFNGLNRYDGYNIRVFEENIKDPEALSNGSIKNIAEDKNGNLWIGTSIGGVNIYLRKFDTFKRLPETITLGSDTLDLSKPTSVTIAPDGNIWIGCSEEGILIFNTDFELVSHINNKNPDGKNLMPCTAQAVLFDTNNNGWIGGKNGQIARYSPENKSFEYFVYDSALIGTNTFTETIFQNSKGIIWIGNSKSGAYYFNPDDMIFHHAITSETEISSFCEDLRGNLYIGQYGKGIDIFNLDNEKTGHLEYDPINPRSLNSNMIYDLYIDDSETLWVGTNTGGLNYHNPYKLKFQKYEVNPLDSSSLSNNNVRAILEDKDGDIWVGTDGGGLNYFDKKTKKFKIYKADPTDKNKIQTNIIIHMALDKEGKIYMGSYNNGLTVYDKGKNIFKQYLPDPDDPESISGKHVWYILEDSQGYIWLGYLNNGIDILDKNMKKIRHYSEVTGDIPMPVILYIYEDKHGTIWAGSSEGGLYRYNRDAETFAVYAHDSNDPQSISHQNVRVIYEDSRNQFWVGTEHGLNLMNRETGRFKVYTTDDGLPDNTINGILEDYSGFLWISTNNGIFKFHPEKKIIKNYNTSDGLQGKEYFVSAQITDKNGIMYFGGKKGFNVLNPNIIMDNPHIPKVSVVNINILNSPYTVLPEKTSKSPVSITEIENIHLAVNQNSITFEFAALDFVNPAKNSYKYKLEGFDEDWITTNSNRRQATYTNLKGGTYTFKVQAANGDGVWNTEGYSVQLDVAFPYWETTWFRISFVAGIILIIFIYIKVNSLNIKREKRKLELMLEKGFNDIKEQKQKLEEKDKELKNKIDQEKRLNWYNNGIMRVNEIIRDQKDDLEGLSKSIIHEFVKHLNVSQGSVYLLNNQDTHLVLMASYAPDKNRKKGKIVEFGEGYVGKCFDNIQVIRTNDLPDGFACLSSGLGETVLDNLTLIPLHLNENIVGVIELLSFKPLSSYQIDFVEKAGKTLTSIIISFRGTEKAKEILEQQKLNSEELTSTEEELKQNLEEMEATEEMSLRKIKELEVDIEEALNKENEYKKEIRNLKSKIKTLENKK